MKIYLESYGCTLNHGEAQYIRKLLSTAAHEIVTEPKNADLIIIFTCTVIKTTELKMLRRLEEFSRLDKPVLVSGCMAVVQGAAVRKVISDAYFLKPIEISRSQTELWLTLSAILDQISAGHVGHVNEPEQSVGGGIIPKTSIDHIVPIATGCLGHCTYCITRLARGSLVSKPEDRIIEDVQAALDGGSFEIRLTAQDTASYGFDLESDESSTLPGLLNRIVNLEFNHDFRVRVGMMNPDTLRTILDDLIDSYKHPRVFKFLHLPVQSGDDDLLAAMGRKYSVAEFLKIVAKFRAELPNLTLSTDIIIGYPGETDDQFQCSMSLLENVKPNIVNITRFSARPGTPAAELENRLPGRVVKARSRAMTKLRFKISHELNESACGGEYRVLVTERVKEGSVLARNGNYQPVVIKRTEPLGSWVEVKITSATDAYLIGELVC